MNTDNSNKTKIRNIALNGIMLAITVALQATNLPNIVTGVFVNSIFVFCLFYVGIKSSITLCLLSPLFGFMTGHIPVFMYPVLPMIALGNCLLVVTLKKLEKHSKWLQFILPALIKTSVICVGGWLMIKTFMPDKIQYFLVFTVLGIQFFTAVPGIWLGTKLSKSIK